MRQKNKEIERLIKKIREMEPGQVELTTIGRKTLDVYKKRHGLNITTEYVIITEGNPSNPNSKPGIKITKL